MALSEQKSNFDNTFETEIVKLKPNIVKIDEKKLLSSENDMNPFIEINNIVFNFFYIYFNIYRIIII